MRRERREMSRNDIDAVENMPDEDPPTPTETILDPWEMAFCPSIRAKVQRRDKPRKKRLVRLG